MSLWNALDPLNILGKSDSGVLKNLYDPLRIISPDMPSLDDPSVTPKYVTNPFLDTLGALTSQRIGRNSLRVDLGSAYPASATTAPASVMPGPAPGRTNTDYLGGGLMIGGNRSYIPPGRAGPRFPYAP